jgi:coenzyme F420-reducing hydrogenase gamma subunit
MKPKIAFFDFASCEGCQLALLDCEDILLDLLTLVDLVEFREALSETSHHYDIAFIEGSIHREQDSQRLQDIRSRSQYLVALGACACHGNVQARSNFIAPAENYQRVYGEAARNRVQVDEKYWPLWAHTRVRAIDEIVPVDFYLRGCPMSTDEFLQLLKALLSHQIPSFPANAVCVECKRNGNECVFDKGQSCLGPIAYGGCDSICINKGHVCDACRGLLPYANVGAHNRLMQAKGLSQQTIQNRYRLFCSAEKMQADPEVMKAE